MHRLARLDQQFIWHPFTQMRTWLRQEPIVIVSGRGAVLRDARGRHYLDANASIWTNLHGHNQPKINAALRTQLGKIAHSSALGLANEPASFLAQRLIRAARTGPSLKAQPARRLERVFFSDDGSTAMEAGLKLVCEFARRTRGDRRPKFLSLQGAYHGDTVGAASLGHIDLFRRGYAGIMFKSDAVPAPYCYRCPFNQARPERADARVYRRCHWECVDLVEKQCQRQEKRGRPYAGFVVEPLMQGAAGMIPQPDGWLKRVANFVQARGTLLIADEVMTGFGRTFSTIPSDLDPETRTARPRSRNLSNALFAFQQAGVRPDVLCLAKGLTGGYLPMGATLVTAPIFDTFLGEYEEFKTFFHGHSYTANQLGAACALASLDLLAASATQTAHEHLEQTLHNALKELWALPNVGDIRRSGLIAGIELVRDWATRAPFPLQEQAGIRVCAALTRRGVLTRPIGNVIVLMPPYCTTPRQAQQMVTALREAIEETFPQQRTRR